MSLRRDSLIGFDRTYRSVGVAASRSSAFIAVPGSAKATMRGPTIYQDPPGLYIPAYQGAPDVGLTDPSALTAYSGSSSLAPGNYVDKEFTGQKFINGSGAYTFTNCWFHSGGANAAVIIYSAPTSVMFTDCLFGKQGEDCDRNVSLAGGEYTALRCKSQYAEDGFKLGKNSTLTMCHVHELDTLDTAAHADCVQIESTAYNTLIQYCNLNARWAVSAIRPTGGNANAATQIKSDLGTISDVTVDHCYLNGGNYTGFYRIGSGGTHTGTKITNNIFGPDFRYGHADWDTGTISQWTNNVDIYGATVPGP